MVDLIAIDDLVGWDDSEGEEKFDFNAPENVLIEIVGEEGHGEDWKGFSIESCTIISGVEGVSGAASYDAAYGGFLDYTIEGMVDCPRKEGWFIVEGITAIYHKGDGWMTDDDMDFNFTGFRPATEEEIKLA